LGKLLYFVSGHGYGHAVRSSLVIAELYKLGITCEIASNAPKSIFDCNLKGVEFGYRHLVSDYGVVQKDFATNDLSATLREWTRLLDSQKDWIEKQKKTASEVKPSAIVSDTSPLPLTLAGELSLPSILITTFTWDWILRAYEDDDVSFEMLADRVGELYREPDLVITTPFNYSLPGFKNLKRVGMIARKSLLSQKELRLKLQLDELPTVLVSFGGFGTRNVKGMELERIDSHQFLFLNGEPETRSGNIISFCDRDVFHADLVRASDFVLTKPGYGIICESVLNQTPVIYTSRSKFAEYELLANEMKKYLPTKFINHKKLFSGELGDLLSQKFAISWDNLKTDSGDGAVCSAKLIAEQIGEK